MQYEHNVNINASKQQTFHVSFKNKLTDKW